MDSAEDRRQTGRQTNRNEGPIFSDSRDHETSKNIKVDNRPMNSITILTSLAYVR